MNGLVGGPLLAGGLGSGGPLNPALTMGRSQWTQRRIQSVRQSDASNNAQQKRTRGVGDAGSGCRYHYCSNCYFRFNILRCIL